MTQTGDRWYRWLSEVRHGGDPVQLERVRQALYPVRDKVLDGASLGASDTVLDVGTGDGLIAFGALDRLGPDGRVIFSHVSADVLEYCRAAVADAGDLRRSNFVRASADELTGIADASVDVVTTRSVLIYVANKAAAFTEFRRVLRPGGRVSIFEPINTLMQECSARTFYGYDVGPVHETAAKVSARLAPTTSPWARTQCWTLMIGIWSVSPSWPASVMCGSTWKSRCAALVRRLRGTRSSGRPGTRTCRLSACCSTRCSHQRNWRRSALTCVRSWKVVTVLSAARSPI